MTLPIEDKQPALGITAVEPAAAPEQSKSVRKRIKSGRARSEDGTWSHAALKTEHRALMQSGSLVPTRILAGRYGVSVTTIKEVLAENAAANANNSPPIRHSHDPFGRCKRSA